MALPWGVLSLRGPDRLSFLHGLGSNGFPSTSEGGLVGTARYTSFTTAHGVLQAYVRCLVTEDDVKLVCEGNSLSSLAAYLDSRIFPSDDVRVVDETERSAIALLCLCAPPRQRNDPGGGDALQLMPPGDARRSDVAFAVDAGAGVGAVTSYSLSADGELGAPAAVAASVLCVRQHAKSSPGCGEEQGLGALLEVALPSLLPQADVDVEVWSIEEAAATVAVYDQLRAASGRVTERDWQAQNVTALEAGLMHAIDFRKGCFVGQEAIARALASARRNADGTAAAVRRRVARLVVETTAGGPRPSARDALVDADGDSVGAVLTVTDAAAAAALLRPAGRYSVRGGAAARVGTLAPPAPGPAPPALVRIFGGAEATPGAVHCLGLVKTSFAVADATAAVAEEEVLYVRPAGNPSRRLRVATVAAAPYPTYHTAYSPAPPVEKIQAAAPGGDADADAVARRAAEEAARKEAKLAEMAKKIAALKKRPA